MDTRGVAGRTTRRERRRAAMAAAVLIVEDAELDGRDSLGHR
jgi:hypothetical protein